MSNFGHVQNENYWKYPKFPNFLYGPWDYTHGLCCHIPDHRQFAPGRIL